MLKVLRDNYGHLDKLGFFNQLSKTILQRQEEVETPKVMGIDEPDTFLFGKGDMNLYRSISAYYHKSNDKEIEASLKPDEPQKTCPRLERRNSDVGLDTIDAKKLKVKNNIDEKLEIITAVNAYQAKFAAFREDYKNLIADGMQYKKAMEAEQKRLEGSADEANKNVRINYKLGVAEEAKDSQIIVNNLHVLALRQNFNEDALRHLDNMPPVLRLGQNDLIDLKKYHTKMIKAKHGFSINKYQVKCDNMMEKLHLTELFLEQQLKAARHSIKKFKDIDKDSLIDLEAKKSDLANIEAEIEAKKREGQANSAIAAEHSKVVDRLTKTMKALEDKIKVKETEKVLLRAERKTLRDDLKKEKDRRQQAIDEYKDSHDLETKQYKKELKDLQKEHAEYTKYFSKAMGHLRKEGIHEMKDNMKYHNRFVKGVTNAAKQQTKLLNKTTGKPKLWTFATIVKLSLLCVFLDLVASLLSFIIYLALTKPDTIQAAFVVSIPLIISIIVISIILDVLVVCAYVASCKFYYHRDVPEVAVQESVEPTPSSLPPNSKEEEPPQESQPPQQPPAVQITDPDGNQVDEPDHAR